MDNINALVDTNRPPSPSRVSNLRLLLGAAEPVGQRLARVWWPPTRPDIDAAVKNIESSTATLKNLLDDVQAGKGLAGKLLENEQIAANVSQIVNNLSITTSNLNRLGLWGILWQHKPPRTTESARSVAEAV